MMLRNSKIGLFPDIFLSIGVCFIFPRNICQIKMLSEARTLFGDGTFMTSPIPFRKGQVTKYFL